MLSAAGISSANAAVAAARQAAPLSLRTAKHDIGFEAPRSTDSAEVPARTARPPSPRALVQRLSWTAL